MAPQEAHVLDVQDLVVEFPRGRRRPPLRAVDRVTFSIGSQETIGLVGESGSGKTTIGRAVLGLVPVTRGRISFCGLDITRADARRRRELSAELQVVFQDPFGSLNPTRTIGQTLTEPLRVHTSLSRAEANIRAAEMLERVGLAPDAVARYPSAFSGGQRQRVAIARALMVNPRLVICDEPVSALDLSVQAQILNLLRELQSTLRLSYLFIAHDLEVVRNLSHRVLVLYRGHVVEEGQVEHVYNRPAHPYTRALLDASPSPDPDVQRFRHRQRAATSSASQASADCGCPFAPRCQYAVEICLTTRPAVETTPSGTSVACHRWPELPPHGVNGSLKPRAAGIR